MKESSEFNKEMNKCNSYDKYVGMDVHKNSISIAVAAAGRGEAHFYGKIDNRPEAIRRLISALAPSGQRLHYCYEAGPCGYGICRQIRDTEHDGDLVAPSLTPRKSGDRVKTDRRDGLTLARLDRAGELSTVWTPSPEHEAIRDLSRARGDCKLIDKQLRQRLGAMLLRHDKRFPGRKNWTQAHFRWLETQRFEQPASQIAYEEYAEAVRQAQSRTARLEQQLHDQLEGWSLGGPAQALTALRGVDWLAGMTLLAELGDLTRFDSPARADGFRRLDFIGEHERSATPSRRDHQSRQRGSSPSAGRMRLGVSLPGTPLAADSTPCREGVAPSPSDRLEGAGAALRSLSQAARQRQTRECRRDRDRAGTAGIHLGNRDRTDPNTTGETGIECLLNARDGRQGDRQGDRHRPRLTS